MCACASHAHKKQKKEGGEEEERRRGKQEKRERGEGGALHAKVKSKAEQQH